MRVSDSARYDRMRSEIARTSTDMARASERLASGKAIIRLSDDPNKAVTADRLLAEDKALDAYASAADNAKAWLATQDTALQSSLSAIHRARELAISAGTTNSQSALNGIAAEVESLREQLVELANTTFDGRSVFGGFSQAAVTNTAGTVNFTGDDGSVNRRVSGSQVVRVNVDGQRAFGFDTPSDVFAALGTIAADLRAGDTNAVTTTGLATLAARFDGLTEALGSVGARTNTVDSAKQAGTSRRDDVHGYRSTLVDADLAESALTMTEAETAYQAVLAATSRLQLPSLVDFLR